MSEDEKWMQLALLQANRAEKVNEVPVGSVIIINNKLVAEAHNQSIVNNDATAHAEIQAIRLAGKKIGNYRLSNATLYVTLEPCAMCYSAIINARISRVVFGAYDQKKRAENLLNMDAVSKLEISGGILENQCSNMLKEFFEIRR